MIHRSLTTTTAAVWPQTADLDLGSNRHGCGTFAWFQARSRILVLLLLLWWWWRWRLLLLLLLRWLLLLLMLLLLLLLLRPRWQRRRNLANDFRSTGCNRSRRRKSTLLLTLMLRR